MKIYVSFFLWLISLSAVSAQTPPAQPTAGPGSTAYLHASVVERSYDQQDLQYWLFEPAHPAPGSAPVIVFNHGWGGMNPGGYQAWIEHIVRRGNIVIFPRYQGSLKTPPTKLAGNAIAAVKNALHRLQTEPAHVRPQLDRLAVVGHSAGGLISANMAALAASAGLPQPLAVMTVEPGKSWGPRRLQIPLADLSEIAPGTLLIAIAGDRDMVARDIDARRIVGESTQVKAQDKSFVVFVSDDHGKPPLVASHFCPVAPLVGNSRGLDALDYFGTWKLFDALTDAAFYNKNRQYALGNTKEQRFMGFWSDGVAVQQLKVNDKP